MNRTHYIKPLNKIPVLPNVAELGYSAITTQTTSGIPQPKTSGIFLPQIYQFTQATPITNTGAVRLSELVTWAICGNKALRTNNATSLVARVEPTLHPHTVQHSLLTKLLEGISMLNSNSIHTKSSDDEFLSFHKPAGVGYIAHVIAKSITEPGNSNNLHTANTSTPFFNRAFFVRSLRIPKENNLRKIAFVAFLSMVGRIGKGSPFAAFRVLQFSSPIRSTAQTLESLAVAFCKFHTELSAMIYKFLSTSTITGTKRLRISIIANSLEEALSKVQFTHRPLLIARLNVNDNRQAKRGIYA